MSRTEPSDLEIRDDMIRLGQLLKLAGLVDDGATAREVIAAGEVEVNGEPDTRRGRQVHPGDVVAFAGQEVRVTRAGRA